MRTLISLTTMLALLCAACGNTRIGGAPAKFDDRLPNAEPVSFFRTPGREMTMESLHTCVAEAELALSRFEPVTALLKLDAFDKEVAALKDTTPAQDVAFGWLTERAREIRFIALIFGAIDDPQTAALYQSSPERMFNRFIDDGTTTASPACYRLFAISGHDAEAERGFARMLKLVEADAVRTFRLRMVKASTLVGLAIEEGRTEFVRACEVLKTLPAAKVEDAAEYGSCLLLPALDLARNGDYAGASAIVQAIIDTGYPASMKPRIDRYSPGLKEIAEGWTAEQTLLAGEKDLPRVEFETDKGHIVITLFEDDAPNTVASFITLTEQGFYDGLVFHRVVPHFVVQGGDPDGTGSGGPGYSIKREMGRKHFRGSIGMARGNDPDSAGSQFYFCLSAATTHHLDAGYAVFGRISEGLDVMDKLRLGGKVLKARVLNKQAHEYKVEKLPEKE
jgi:cyclophilin family peptidyl-prolyl cis-trans isomerase